MAKPATITAGLVKKKGEAGPSSAHQVNPAALTNVTDAKGYYKSLTLKLDRDQYQALKRAGLEYDKKSQTILVEALALWLQTHFPH